MSPEDKELHDSNIQVTQEQNVDPLPKRDQEDQRQESPHTGDEGGDGQRRSVSDPPEDHGQVQTMKQNPPEVQESDPSPVVQDLSEPQQIQDQDQMFEVDTGEKS